MGRWLPRLGVALLLVMLAGIASASAQGPVVGMRVGSHDDYGRLVFDWHDRVDYRVDQDGARVTVRFAEPAQFRLGAARRSVRNVRSVYEAQGAVVIETVPGARVRHFRVGNRIVFDVHDPTAASARATEERDRVAAATPARPPASPPARPPEPPAAAAEAAPPAAAAARQAPAPTTPQATPAPAALPAPRATPAERRQAALPTPPPRAPTPRAPAPDDGETYTQQQIAAMSEEERLRLGFFAVMAVLDPNPPSGVRMFRYFIERNLRHLGYGTSASQPMSDENLREAVAAYQRQIGAAPTGRLTVAEGERLLRAPNLLSETRISAGPKSLTLAEEHATASGTWVGEDEPFEFPINRSHITCFRQEARCFEASSRVALSDNESAGVLLTSFVIYQVTDWSADGIRAEIDWPCATDTLTLRREPSTATVQRRPKPLPDCRDAPGARAATSTLEDGFASIWQFYEQRRAVAVSDISPELRAFMESIVAAPANAAATAARR